MKAIFSIWIVCVVSSLCLAADPERPPKLTFDKQVDYLKWYDDFLSKGRTDNALDLYIKLANDDSGNDGFPMPSGKEDEQLKRAMQGPWSPDTFPELKTYLDECDPFLKTFTQAAQKPSFWHRPDPDARMLYQVKLPILVPCRNAVKALIAQCWKQDKNQATQLLMCWEAVLKHSKQLEEGFLISHLVSFAQRAPIYTAMRSAVKQNILRGKNLNRGISLLQMNGPRSHGFQINVFVEWGVALDTLQFVAPEGKVDVNRWGEYQKQVIANKQSQPGLFDPRRTLEEIEDYYQKLSNLVKEPISLKSLRSVRDLQELMRAAVKRSPFSSVVIGEYSKAFELGLRSEADRRGTLLILAMHAYKSKTKNWPKTLGDLKIKGLKTLRIDPYSNKDFIYKLADGNPLLYSIGADGNDDGGRHDAKWGEGKDGGDFVFWPVQD